MIICKTKNSIFFGKKKVNHKFSLLFFLFLTFSSFLSSLPSLSSLLLFSSLSSLSSLLLSSFSLSLRTFSVTFIRRERDRTKRRSDILNNPPLLFLCRNSACSLFWDYTIFIIIYLFIYLFIYSFTYLFIYLLLFLLINTKQCCRKK